MHNIPSITLRENDDVDRPAYYIHLLMEYITQSSSQLITQRSCVQIFIHQGSPKKEKEKINREN